MQDSLESLAHQTTQRITRRFYHPELDVLRFAAFLTVFISHAFPQRPDFYVAHGFSSPVASLAAGVVHSGQFGVSLFFLLSSFLITTLLLREQAATGRLDLWSFYIRRTLRIWPLYFFFLALGFWVLPAWGWPRIPNIHKASFSLFLGNWSIVLFQRGWHPAFPTNTAISLLWSVSVEEQFYVSWALALMLFGGDRLRKMAFVLLATATFTRLILLPHHAGESVLLYGTIHSCSWTQSQSAL